jgi:hypothetical protein
LQREQGEGKERQWKAAKPQTQAGAQSTRKALNEGMDYRGVEQFRGCGAEFLIHEGMDTSSVRLAIARLS